MDPHMPHDQYEDYDSDPDGGTYESLISYEIRNEIVSLKDTCLNTVIRHFQRFNSAFLTSQDEILLGNIHFLRRTFSAEILRLYPRIGEFSESCVRFLIGEYLKELDLTSFTFFTLEMKEFFLEEIVQKRISEIGHNLAKVIFETYPFSDYSSPSFINNCIIHLKNVYSLCIPSYHAGGNETLRIISSSCPKLKELHVTFWSNNYNQDCAFSDGGVKNLCPLENGVLEPNRSLRKLTFSTSFNSTNPVTESDLIFLLENLPLLEITNHPLLPKVLHQTYHQNLSNGTLGSSKVYNLTYINLLNEDSQLPSTLSEVLSACCKVCPRVRKLSTFVSSDEDLNQISFFPELESLKIVSAIPKFDLNRFIKLKGGALRQLVLYSFSVSVDVLIQSCQKLEYLCMSRVSLRNDTGFKERNDLFRIRKLYLQNSLELGFKGPVCVLLNSCSNLEKLSFSNYRLLSSGTMLNLRKFFATSVLKSITFRKSKVHPMLLYSILVNCSHLRTLTLNRINLGVDIIGSLFKFLPCKRHCLKINYLDSEDYLDWGYCTATSDSEDEDFFLD